MDEKVIYPPKSDQNDQAAAEVPPAATDPNAPAAEVPTDGAAPADSAVDATADPAADTSADPAAEPAAEGDGSADAAAEGEEAVVEEDEPPFYRKKSFLIKILIGVGILIVIIFLVTLLTSQNQSKEVKLTWWGLWEDSKAIQVVIDDFEKANPNIKIEYIKKDHNQYRKTLQTRIANGSGPDIFRYHNSWVPMMSEMLTPLSADVINPEEFKKVYPPVMQNDLTKNGAIYGIPLDADSLSMFVNTDILTKAGFQAPSTWEDFVTIARKLTVVDPDTHKIKTAGAALGTMNNISHASDIISMLFVQQGITDMATFTDPTNMKRQGDALDFYTGFVKGDQKVWDEKLDESWLAFARGNVGLFFGYSWDVFRIQQINKSLQYKVFPVPGLQGGKNATIASYWVEGASSKGKHQKEALLFMKYLAKKETAQKLYTEQAKVRTFGEPYARTDLADTLKDNPLVYPFVSQLPYGHSTYFASDTHDTDTGLNYSLNTYLGTVVNIVATSGQETANALKPFNQGVAKVYKDYNIGQPEGSL